MTVEFPAGPMRSGKPWATRRRLMVALDESCLIESTRRRFDLPPGDMPAETLIQIERDMRSDDDEIRTRACRSFEKMVRPR